VTPALEALFAPGAIGGLSFRNRLVMPPMGTNYATWTGAVTERLIRYHAERARGGVGLITVEFSYVHPTGKISGCALGVHDDGMVPGLARLVGAIHAEGARASIQIAHGGRRCRSAITGTQPLAPSAVPCVGGEVPRPLSPTDIDRVVSWFAQAARRVREAGFDAVTLHLANGYLLQSFVSPYANQRLDEYGGNLDHRMRLPVEVLGAVRRTVGAEFPIICRVCVDEFIDGGLTLTEGRQVAQLLERAGADAIDVCAGIPESLHVIGPPMATPRGFLASHARAIKDAVRIPVFAVGRINDPRLADQIVRDGSADFIAMGRPLLADPLLPDKARQGRFDDIVPCIACNEGCFQRLYLQLDVSCVVNPRVGREALFPAEPAPEPRRVLVVGGGPAGMTAALTAAARGHRVLLCERGPELGGQLLMGDVPPHKDEIRTLREHLVARIAKSTVETRLGTPVTEALVREIGADIVIVATGARPREAPVRAVDTTIVSAWDVLSGRAITGSRVVVIGGGEVGCELAEYLATQGKDVVIVEVLGDLALTMEPRARTLLIQRLRGLGVTAMLQSRVDDVRGSTVTYERGGLTDRIEDVDTVVSAVGSLPDSDLGDALGASEATLCRIGDCVKPRRILEAIREGFERAYAI
jgi:2,4-dienoyl-CoA reductase-like NADH-dependent reductase (Old Yellow Enzyme family)/thioredoxin reductase